MNSAKNGWFSPARLALSACMMVPVAVFMSVAWLRWYPGAAPELRQEEIRKLTAVVFARFGEGVAGWLLPCPTLIQSVSIAAVLIVPWSLGLLALARSDARPTKVSSIARELGRDFGHLSLALALTQAIALTCLALSLLYSRANPQASIDSAFNVDALFWSASLLVRTLILSIPYLALLSFVRALFGARRWIALLAYTIATASWAGLDQAVSIVRPGTERWLSTQLPSQVLVFDTKQLALGVLTCCAWGAACVVVTILSLRLAQTASSYRQKVFVHANHV